VSIAVLAVVLLAAGNSHARGAVPAKAPMLASMLLAVRQMPTGWNVDNSPGSGFGCLHNVLEPPGVKQTAGAAVTFQDQGALPQVEEKLATYTTAAGKVFAMIIGTLDRCKHFSGSSGGHKVTGTVGQMSFPGYGVQSAAFVASFTISGLTADEDVLIVRKGDVLVGMSEGAISSPNVAQFQGFVRLALARVH
jgi:hypothetical protein